MAFVHGNLGHLLPSNYKRLISEWLEEDCPSFDYGGFVVGESEGSATLLGKSAVCSLPSQIRQALETDLGLYVGRGCRCPVF